MTAKSAEDGRRENQDEICCTIGMKCSETERQGCFRLKYIDNIKDRGLVGNLINESIPIGTLICCDGKPDQAIPKKTGQDYLRDDKIKKVVEIMTERFI